MYFISCPRNFKSLTVILKITSLLHKPEALQHDIKVDYLGFNVPNKFLLGYGLDYDGLARNLPEIYQLDEA